MYYAIRELEKRIGLLRGSPRTTFGAARSGGGFTFIELLLYMALTAIFLTGAITFTFDVLDGREKAFQRQLVEQNARTALARIAYEIRRARNIMSVGGSQLILDNGGGTTTIDLSGGEVRLTTGGAGPFALTANHVIATNLAFTDLRSGDNNTKGVRVSLTVQQAPGTLLGPALAATTMVTAAELNGSFNEARALLMDTSGARRETVVVGNKKIDRIIGTTLQDSGTSSITIDKITVSWTGGNASAQIRVIKIGGVTVWNSAQPSGTILDIVPNVTLNPGAAPTPIDAFEFTATMASSTVTVRYTMVDGSTVSFIMVFG